MTKHHPDIPFERFADDVLCHCDSERQAQELQEQLEQRLAECGLELHPSKTRIGYCKDDDRRVPKWGPHGSVRGALRKERPYRESCTTVWKSTAPAAAASSPRLLSAAAYVLYQELRLRAARTAFRSAQVGTLREQLMKLGAWVESSVRRIVLHLPAPS